MPTSRSLLKALLRSRSRKPTSFRSPLVGDGWWCCRRNYCCPTIVHQIFQFLAGFEERDFLCRNFHPVTRLRISAHARLALARAETAEPAYLDLIAHSQRAYYAVKDRIHNHFAIFAGKF